MVTVVHYTASNSLDGVSVHGLNALVGLQRVHPAAVGQQLSADVLSDGGGAVQLV